MHVLKNYIVRKHQNPITDCHLLSRQFSYQFSNLSTGTTRNFQRDHPRSTQNIPRPSLKLVTHTLHCQFFRVHNNGNWHQQTVTIVHRHDCHQWSAHLSVLGPKAICTRRCQTAVPSQLITKSACLGPIELVFQRAAGYAKEKFDCQNIAPAP